MSESTKTGFRLLTESNTATVVGKAWWNESLQLAKGGDARRVIVGAIGAFVGLQVVSGVCGVVGVMGNAFDSSDDSHQTRRERALAMQQQHGWTFGAADEAYALQFTGAQGAPGGAFRQQLMTLATSLAPKNPALAPSYVPTLFQSTTARPTTPADPDLRGGSSDVALADVLRPIGSPQMETAATDARWLKKLLGTQSANVAVIVDLVGPASVAFATEIADRFDPVFCFDNWPHPRGVVRAHETLAAAATLAPKLDAAKATRTGTEPPVFVLDRQRLTPYVDQENTFDNRSMARLPSTDTLKRLGIKHVLYIAPAGSNPVDLDDVNSDLVGYASGGLDVRTVDFNDWYAVTDNADAIFAQRYGLYTAHPLTPAPTSTTASSWLPLPRTTGFGAVAIGTDAIHAPPTGFGEVPVVVAASGIVLGAMMYRSGSWNRTTSYSYGGG